MQTQSVLHFAAVIAYFQCPLFFDIPFRPILYITQ